MARLEDITPGTAVKGILPDGLVTVVSATWHGSSVVELTYKDAAGRLGHEFLYRDREPTIEIASVGRPWSFDGDGALLRLVSEAYRIRLAYLFDPLLAVHISLVEPLPHQMLTTDELARLVKVRGSASLTMITRKLYCWAWKRNAFADQFYPLFTIYQARAANVHAHPDLTGNSLSRLGLTMIA